MVALAASVSFLATGCADERAQARLERRDEQMRRTVQVLRDDEASRKGRLIEAVDVTTARSREDTQRFPAAINGVGEQLKAETERWRERQPEYQKAIERELGGDLQGAADTLPEIIY